MYFSVVVPVYNKAPHICRCVTSVLAQTFNDYELILINDASTDNSLEEARKISDPRIRVLCRPEPGPGGYAARNLGIKKARGKWVAFLDADDEWHPVHLEKMYALSREFPDVCFMAAGWEESNGREIKPCRYFELNKSGSSHLLSTKEFLQNFIKKQGPVCTIVACVRRNSPVAENLFPREKHVKKGGDLYAWLKLICHHKIMAWSPYLAAVYHMDSINMVTKKEDTALDLLSKATFHSLAKGLSRDEKLWLKKYFNFQIKKLWFKGIEKRGRKPFFLLVRVFWAKNLFRYLYFSVVSFLPTAVINHILLLRQTQVKGTICLSHTKQKQQDEETA